MTQLVNTLIGMPALPFSVSWKSTEPSINTTGDNSIHAMNKWFIVCGLIIVKFGCFQCENTSLLMRIAH